MTAIETDWYCTVDEAAEVMKVSRSTLYEALKRGYDQRTGTAYINGVPIAHNISQGEIRPCWRVIRAGLRQHAGLPADDDDPNRSERHEIVMGF